MPLGCRLVILAVLLAAFVGSNRAVAQAPAAPAGKLVLSPDAPEKVKRLYDAMLAYHVERMTEATANVKKLELLIAEARQMGGSKKARDATVDKLNVELKEATARLRLLQATNGTFAMPGLGVKPAAAGDFVSFKADARVLNILPKSQALIHFFDEDIYQRENGKGKLYPAPLPGQAPAIRKPDLPRTLNARAILRNVEPDKLSPKGGGVAADLIFQVISILSVKGVWMPGQVVPDHDAALEMIDYKPYITVEATKKQ